MIRLAIIGCLLAGALAGAPLTITTAAIPNAVVAKPYTFQMNATGGTPPYQWSASNLELFGMRIDPATGIISGLAYGARTDTIAIAVTDSNQLSVTASFSFTSTPPVTVTTTTLPDGKVGAAYSTTIVASGGTQYSFGIALGSIPPGLRLETTGVLHGIPQLYGLYTFSVRVTDVPTGNTTFKDFSLNIAAIPALAVSLPADLKFTYNVFQSLAIPITGGTPPYKVSNSTTYLPPGLQLIGDPPAIAGTPLAPGTYNFSLVVTDAQLVSATFNYRILVTGKLVVDSNNLPSAHTSSNYFVQLQASGGAPPYTWSYLNGNLPAGLTISTTGILSGTTPAQAGAYRFAFSVVDLAGTKALPGFELDVLGVAIMNSSLPAGVRGAAYSTALAATGGQAPYTWTVTTGSLPPGLSISGGTLAGAPSVNGSYSFTLRATDSTGAWAEQVYTITVTGSAPSFTADQVVNAASFTAGVSPGALFTVQGTQFAGATTPAGTVPLPTALGGVSLEVNGAAVPLLVVTPTQINAQMPFSVTGSTVNIEVVSDGVRSGLVPVDLKATAPGLFLVSAGRLLAINPNGDLNSLLKPALPDDVVILYATGLGLTSCPLFEGGVAPVDRLCPLLEKPTATVGGLPAEVIFAGAAPGLSTGLIQLNVRIPATGAGEWPVILSVTGGASNAPKIFVAAK